MKIRPPSEDAAAPLLAHERAPGRTGDVNRAIDHKIPPTLLHLLPSFRSSERRPQLRGCCPFPRSESSIERIRILVAEQKCHFRNIHLRPVEVLVRHFLPKPQAATAGRLRPHR